MGTKSIRLSSILTFDEEQEKDIIEFVSQLNSSHKTGQFISNLIRIAMDCPEVIMNGTDGDTLRQLNINGMSLLRQKFMTAITKEVASMKSKVDDVYDQSYKVYMLAQMGKHLGIEEKSKNNLMADFVLEKQLRQLQSSLGVTLKEDLYVGSKLKDTQVMADESLEYIIDTYSGIVNELKSMFEVAQPQVQIIEKVIEKPIEKTEVTEQKVEELSEKTTEKADEQSNDIVDFGDANKTVEFGSEGLSDLSSFFGGA